MGFSCNIILCPNKKFWLLFKFFTKITFEIMKPIYILSFINAQAVFAHLLLKFQKNYSPYKNHRLNKTETQTNQ